MLNPELTVAAIIERNGRFLIVEEWVRGQRVLNQPAGHVEPGETLVEAVIRETREETAWTFEPTALTGAYLWRAPCAARHILRHVYCGQGTAPAANCTLDEGIIRTHWLSYADLAGAREQLRTPMVLNSLDDYLAGQRHACNLAQRLDPAAVTP